MSMKLQSLFENLQISAGSSSDPVRLNLSDYRASGYFSLDLKVASGAVQIYYKAGNSDSDTVSVEGGGVLVTSHNASSGEGGRLAYDARIGPFRKIDFYAVALNGEAAEIEKCTLNFI